MSENKNQSGGKFVVGALLGAITGAAMGILFAPRSGKETRKIIKDKADDYKEKGMELAEKGAQNAKDAWDKGRKAALEKAEDVKEQAVDMIEEAKEKALKLEDKK